MFSGHAVQESEIGQTQELSCLDNKLAESLKSLMQLDHEHGRRQSIALPASLFANVGFGILRTEPAAQPVSQSLEGR